MTWVWRMSPLNCARPIWYDKIRIVKELENCLVKRSIFTARLEIGIHQHEAIDLYKWLGYSETAPFGDYTEDPLSVFMEKKIV